MSDWRAALECADEQLDLARLAMLIAAGEYTDLDVEAQLDEFDELAGRVPVGDISVASLRRLMFDDLRFKGNRDDYYDPRNSYLNNVLERRQGIPITLSVVFLEIGWRLGLDLAPVSFPGHFIVRVGGCDSDLFVDAFHNGIELSRETLLQRFRQTFGEQVARATDQQALFGACPRREVVARMLRNLKQIYLHKRDWERSLRITDQLLLVDPSIPGEWRDRGHLYAQIGHMEAAIKDYTHYLQLAPDAADAQQVRQLLVHSASNSTRLN